jgi:hypothetical protein
MYAAADHTCQSSSARRIRPSVHRARRRCDDRAGKGSPLTALALFLVVAISLIAVGALPTLADGVPAPATSHAVTVSAADTLWSIARANSVAGMSTADMVQAIRRVNGLVPGRELQPGAVVKVPIVVDDGGVLALR